ncbi:hypothetical protein KP509_32G015300 [Ceratopteris richardii]|uniref:CAAX prenyl protease 2/Lysostaphin resistance protein A-like domain-containing protein n=1 Tax=Ceratopteris richardii TaxID=49495 RepID=A0A8T2QTD2_CERRI|nr:hypothetical protein KP509_32G015300 [Ceratopteris richardii]KAH7286621.1 hypothetical protein KP509_32G015300 [Ceratopteris richardii]KAH7286622.1 hypothetical protein KP509_32G015300 [Ceratopteris richardii]KAH7286623.1 hypothetical protein KP509_32G015300 [Ceratopteris richardii]
MDSLGKAVGMPCLSLERLPASSTYLRLVVAPRGWSCPGPFRWPGSSSSSFHFSSSRTLGISSRHFLPIYAGSDDNDIHSVELQPKENENPNVDFFVKWEIPWDGKTVIVTMTAFGLSFLFTGFTLSILLAQLGLRQRQLLDFDERSLLIFINQTLETFVGISVLKVCTKNYNPLPSELFNFDLKDPFSISRGWILWGIIGTVCGAGAVLLAGTLATYINGEPLPREGQDALLQLLPLIGTSNTSTALLLAVTGILAPFLEETIFRGFLLTSLTKWVPTYAAVTLSAGAFALAHLTPGEIPQLFALGVVLGFSYCKTGNLLTPMLIHSMWNSGVLLLLTLLRIQGYDIQELI